MSSSVDQQMIDEISQGAEKARYYGIIFIITGLAVLSLRIIPLPIIGIRTMAPILGIILIGSGILFSLGSFSVPKNRKEIIERLQKVMLDNNPERRLWAAQRLVGYAKDANFTKEEILLLARHAKKIVLDPPTNTRLQVYIATDHIVFIREIIVNVKMDKHTRKDFVRIIKPLNKVKGLPDEAYEILADAIAYHPSKLPVQAYSDYLKLKEEPED